MKSYREKREDGFYFVKYYSELIVARWSHEADAWFFTGIETSFDENSLDFIYEKKLTIKDA